MIVMSLPLTLNRGTCSISSIALLTSLTKSPGRNENLPGDTLNFGGVTTTSESDTPVWGNVIVRLSLLSQRMKFFS